MANAGRKIQTQKEFNYRRHSWGAGCQYIESKVLWADMATTGMSYQSFMLWLRAMQVPVIHAGKCKLVNLQSFKIGLIASTQIGRPDFLTPGCATLKRLGRRYDPKHYTTHLDPEYLHKNLSTFIEELLLSRASAGYFITDELRGLANSIADTYITEAARLAPLLKAQEVADGRRAYKKRIIRGTEQQGANQANNELRD